MESEVTNLAQVKAFDSSAYATAAQGVKADNALSASSVSAFGVNLIDDADSSEAKNTLGLAAVASSGDYSDLTNVPSTAGAAIYNNAGSPALDTGITSSEVNFLLGLGSTDNVTFNSVTANLTGNVTGNVSGSSGSTTGNAATATALETARNIGGVSFDGTADINLPGVNTTGDQDTSGNAATATLASTVTVSDETSNTDFPIVFNDESNGLLDDTGSFVYNPSTGALTSSTFVGNLTGNVSGSSGSTTGNAATATALNTTTDGIVKTTGGDGTLSIGVLVSGDIPNNAADTSGNAATATEATNITATANNTTNETVYPAFVDGALGGTEGIETDSGLTYNPSTGALTSSTFVGNLTGDVTGNVSGSSGSTTGNAATATLASTVTVNTPADNDVANQSNLSSTYSSTAVIGTGARTFAAASSLGTRVFNAGINLDADSQVIISLNTNPYYDNLGTLINLQVIISNINETNDTFTIKCYYNNNLLEPAADFNFSFIAIK